MGVTLENGVMTLMYDPELIEKLDHKSIVLILIHEVMHLSLNHIPRFLRLLANTPTELQRKKATAVANIAMDYAVNSFMVQLHECTQNDLQKGMGDYAGVYPSDVNLPPGKSFEWYLAYMMKDVKVIAQAAAHGGGIPIPGMGSGGDGEGSGMSDEQAVALLEEYHKKGAPTSNHETLSKASEEMNAETLSGMADKTERTAKRQLTRARESTKGRGTMPGGLEELLNEFLKPPTVPWEKILRRWIVNTRRIKAVRSMRRPKRRMLVGQDDACTFPGRASDRKYNLLYAIDTSGSMSSDDLQKCLIELQGVQKSDDDISITVIEADTVIHKEYEIGPNSKVDFKVLGRGGTTFDDVFIRAKELKPDAVVYATDGYAPLPALHNRVTCPVIWVLTPSGVFPGSGYGGRRDTSRGEYGRAIRITT